MADIIEWRPREQVLEDWIANDPGRVCTPGSVLLGRQVDTGEGRLDLLVFEPPQPSRHRNKPAVTVVEIKRDVVTLPAVSQVCRYMNDVQTVFPDMVFRLPNFGPEWPELRGLLVAPRIEDDAAEVVAAVGRLRYVGVYPEIRFSVGRDAINEVGGLDRQYIGGTKRSEELARKIADAVVEGPTDG